MGVAGSRRGLALKKREKRPQRPETAPGGTVTGAYGPNKNLATATTGGTMSGVSFSTAQDSEDRLTQYTQKISGAWPLGTSSEPPRRNHHRERYLLRPRHA